MKKVLEFLSGKKGIIASILMTFVAYLANKGIISEAETILIGSLCTIIFGGVSYATKTLVYKK